MKDLNLQKNFHTLVNEENYILSQSNDFEGTLFAKKNPEKYDLIIGNPPYLRIMRKSEEAESMPTVVHGAPNLYFLFAAMSLFNLKDDADSSVCEPG